MTAGIVYCSVCGARILLREVEEGQADVIDGVYFCATCGAPPPRRNPDTQPPIILPATEPPRRRIVPTPRPSRAPLFVVAGALCFLAIPLAIFVVARRKEEAPSSPAPAARGPAPVSKPAEPSAAERRLESLSAAARGDESFERADEIGRGLLELREKAPELRGRIEAVERDYRDRMEKAAEKRRDEVMKEARTLEEQGRFEEAIRAIDAFPRALRGTPSWEGLAAVRRKLEEKAAGPPPRPWHELFADALKLHKKKEYAEAKKLYLQAMAVRPDRAPAGEHESRWYYVPYNLAEVCAIEAARLSGEARAKAVEECRLWLTRAIKDGYAKRKCGCHKSCAKHFREDRDFEIVRSEPWFRELVAAAGE